MENKCVLIRFGVRPVVASRAALLESVAKGRQPTGRPLRQNEEKPGWFSVSEYELAAALHVSARRLAGRPARGSWVEGAPVSKGRTSVMEL